MNNFDFFEELYKSLSTENENTIVDAKTTQNNNPENVCLITQEPLIDYNIKLTCGHSFNYEPLFHEVYHQKVDKPLTSVAHLRIDEFLCPYCRVKQKFLLPELPSHLFYLGKHHGVNKPKKYCLNPNRCIYKYASGKKKGLVCDKSCFKEYCNSHTKLIEQRKTKTANLKNKNATTNKNKDETKTNTPTILFSRQCCSILKSGKNKGEQCNCFVKYKTKDEMDSYAGKHVFCGRHKNQNGPVVIIDMI